MKYLRITEGADSVRLPEDAVTQTFAILARKGAGKTYTGSVMAEEMIGAGLPVTILDPLGAWWGLRSSADGEKAGLPVTILGGDHGDLPLEASTGKVVAELVVEHPGAYILDLSAFESNSAQDRFTADFAGSLYRLKNAHRYPMHLFVDEADSFAPQRPMPGQQTMLGAFEAIVRRGRIRGLGVTLITQRAAVLNKNVLTQVECLITLQTTGPQDVGAIDDWIKLNASAEHRATFLANLNTLAVGQAWVWSPAWLKVFAKVQIRQRRTFDSSRTPGPGDVLVPKRMAAVDLEALRSKLQASIEKAEANDPNKLRARIRDLEKQLNLQAPAKPQIRTEQVKVPTITPEMSRAMGKLGKGVQQIMSLAAEVLHATTDLGRAAEQVKATNGAQRIPVSQDPKTQAQVRTAIIQRDVVSPVLRGEPPTRLHPERNTPITDGDSVLDYRLGRAERLVLNVLAQHPEGRTVRQVALQTAYSSKGGGFRNALGNLRTLGLIQGRGTLTITDAGREQVPEVDPLPTGRDLLDHWLGQLGKAERESLTVLYEAYPSSLTTQQVAEMTGYSAEGGGFRNALGKLRTLELISGRGDLQASQDLFE